ncbi:MAG: nicotinate-nucleotide adenylyltransferase [Chloroflexota bacterium]|nr:nicotinate-nucleotide adenylyltransferase [Chloroflexota bacterium]
MRRIGLVGGTFDPPHIVHLVLAEFALDALKLDAVWFLPAADPPHKDDTRTAIEHRLVMLEAAIQDRSAFTISRIDIDRPGPHFTVETLRLLRAAHADAEFYFVMGGDSLRDLPRWSRPAELLELCTFVVMGRPDVTIAADMHEATLPGLKDRVILIDSPMLGFSSTEIAARLRAGKSVRYLVPDAVLSYIEQHGLYR